MQRGPVILEASDAWLNSYVEGGPTIVEKLYHLNALAPTGSGVVISLPAGKLSYLKKSRTDGKLSFQVRLDVSVFSASGKETTHLSP